MRNVEFVAAVKEIELPDEIARASVCLGVFGESAKAQRVIEQGVPMRRGPDAVWQPQIRPQSATASERRSSWFPPAIPRPLRRALRSLHGDALKQAGARARAAFLERFSEDALVEDFRGILGVLASRARMRHDDKGACS